MDLEGTSGSVGNQIRINDAENFFFYYDGKKFDYKNFRFFSLNEQGIT